MNIESRKVSYGKISYLDHLMVLHETPRNPPFQRVYTPVKRRHGGITQTFPIKLHTMLDEIEQKGLHGEIIRWSLKGDSFIIFKAIEFAKVLLPIYFRTNKLSSFQRQLNGYGFTKFNLQASTEDIQIYYHPDFHRDRADLLKLVTRRSVFDRDSVESLKNQQAYCCETNLCKDLALDEAAAELCHDKGSELAHDLNDLYKMWNPELEMLKNASDDEYSDMDFVHSKDDIHIAQDVKLETIKSNTNDRSSTV